MDWTWKDDTVNGLFFSATLASCRGGHIPFVQAGAETCDTGAEAVKSDPAVPGRAIPGGLVPMSGMKVRSLVMCSYYSAFYW